MTKVVSPIHYYLCRSEKRRNGGLRVKALILAAGMGTRLKPITDFKPKCMVEINGKPIIYKQIDNLAKNGIKDITVIAGYKSEMLKNALKQQYPFVKVVINDRYATTNNMYSAYLAKEYYSQSEFLLMNADVFYDESVISELASRRYKNSIVVEKGVYNVESMKVRFNNGHISEISKKIPKEKAYGVSIDVYKFSAQGSKVFFEKVIEYIELRKELNHWTEVALNEILSEVTFIPCPLKGRWMEIDNYDDLKKAECIFS